MQQSPTITTIGILLLTNYELLILPPLTLAQFELEQEITCSESYCIEQKLTAKCPPFLNCTKTIGHKRILYPGQCNCCSYCYNYLESGQSCRTQSGLPTSLCGLLFQCNDNSNSQDSTCGVMIGAKGSCSDIINDYNKRQEAGSGGSVEFRPHCNAHGKYNPKQCLTASSICICMDEDGNAIFGLGFANDLMDCACSRDMDRLKSLGLLADSPRCLSNGDYNQLQCYLRRRTCHCRLKPSHFVPMSRMKELPCYDAEVHSEKYVGPCEVARGELDGFIYADSQEPMTSVLISNFPRCDLDGTFAPIQSNDSNWICVNSLGIQIESFQVQKTKLTPLNPPSWMTCHCARVRHFLGTKATGKPKCDKSGNYRRWQCTGSICYCVDALLGRQDMTQGANGRPIEVPRDRLSELHCYSNGYHDGYDI